MELLFMRPQVVKSIGLLRNPKYLFPTKSTLACTSSIQLFWIEFRYILINIGVMMILVIVINLSQSYFI